MIEALNTVISVSAPVGDITSTISAIDLTVITKNIGAVITAGAGVTVAAVALKKGWGYFVGFLKRI